MALMFLKMNTYLTTNNVSISLKKCQKHGCKLLNLDALFLHQVSYPNESFKRKKNL